MQRFGDYLESLRQLSTSSLDRSAESLVASEKQHVARVVAHLSEISRRKAHLELGYRNLFDYCVKHLGLSEGSTYLRIQVANVCHRFPEVLEAMARNEISLTVAGKLAGHLTRENVSDLLDRAKGKSRREIEQILVSLVPRPVVTPGIRRRPQGPDVPTAQAVVEAPKRTTIASLATHLPQAREEKPRTGGIEPAQPEVYNFRFAAGQPFRDKLARLAEVLGVHDSDRDLATVLEKALDLALDQKDPQRRRERREKRSKSDVSHRPDEAAASRSRYIPVAVRERVLARAGYRCEYRSPGGRRCGERTGLQIDHRKPFGLGGGGQESNLRALCGAHNRWSAERVFGRVFMERKIRERAAEVRGSPSHCVVSAVK